MYLPILFREDRREVQFELIRQQPLGVLISHGSEGLLANSVPFIAYPDEGELGVLRVHVARANGQWEALQESGEALVVFGGPQAYVSPNWYPSKADTHKVVPTWNYASVHVWAKVAVMDDAGWLRRQIGDLTTAMEGGRPAPWKVSDAPSDFIDTQLKAIVGLELRVTRVEGKWKMSQNRNDADRAGVIAGLRAQGGAEQAEVARGVEERRPLP